MDKMEFSQMRQHLGKTQNQNAKLPCIGVSSWTSLLVYKWCDLSGRGAGKLAKEDEMMPTVRCIPAYILFPFWIYSMVN